MKKTFFLFLAIICISLSACKKTGTLTVRVQKQSAGQAVQSAGTVEVIVINTSDASKTYLGITSQGTVIIEDVNPATYNVSAQVWDGNAYLTDGKNVTVEKGKDSNVSLLLD